MTRSLLEKRFPYALAGFLGGALIFLYLYGTAVLNPAFDAWIFNGYDETDIWQHYAGWNLFRNSDWAFPLGFTQAIHYPTGATITYTDSAPWISITLKLFRDFLPETFQWYGIYTLISFGLQGAAGALLTCRKQVPGLYKLSLAFLGGLLFACIPSLWDRSFRHVALSSQWLLIWAFYACLEYRDSFRLGKQRFPLLISLLALLSVGIHPYYLPMVMMCAAVAAVECFLYTRRWCSAAGQFVLPAIAAVAGGVVCGAFAGNGAVSRYGYGLYAMNVNAVINPISVGGYDWSKILEPIPHSSSTLNDGFNYLGLGLLLLIGAALVRSALRCSKNPGAVKAWWLRNWVLFAACLFMTGFAITNRVHVGSFEVVLPFPWQLEALCGIFRASSRMFYFTTVCMIVFGITALQAAVVPLQAKNPAAKALVLAGLLLVLGLQLWDTGNVAAEKKARFSAPVMESVAYNDLTRGIGEGHDYMICTSLGEESDERILALLAAKEGMATNAFLSVLGGTYEEAEQLRIDTAAQLQAGVYSADTVYVTRNAEEYKLWKSVFAADTTLRFVETHGCYFLIP